MHRDDVDTPETAGSSSSEQARTGVVVVNEGDGLLGPVADDAGRLVVLVAKPPVLTVLDGLLQDALGREVEGGRRAAGAVDPIDDRLPRIVLVVVQLRTVPPAPQQRIYQRGLEDWENGCTVDDIVG